MVIGGYLIAGAGAGGIWIWHSSDPLWKEAARLTILLGIASVLSAARNRRLERRGKRRKPLRRFILAKLFIVVAAVVCTLALDRHVSHVDAWVSAGMFIVIVTAGPSLHSWLSYRVTEVPAGASRPAD
jgi:hypothetical protein